MVDISQLPQFLPTPMDAAAGLGRIARGAIGPNTIRAGQDAAQALGQGNYGAALGSALRVPLAFAENAVTAPGRVLQQATNVVAPAVQSFGTGFVGGLNGVPVTTTPHSVVAPQQPAVRVPGDTPYTMSHVRAVDAAHAAAFGGGQAGGMSDGHVYNMDDWKRDTKGMSQYQMEKLLAAAPPIVSPKEAAVKAYTSLIGQKYAAQVGATEQTQGMSAKDKANARAKALDEYLKALGSMAVPGIGYVNPLVGGMPE